MGITNAGKSTLINKLLKEQGIKKEILATNKPNTTLDFIKLRIGEYTLYDTPGFSYENSDSALITKEIKPITYQIKPHTTLVINDRYRIHFKEQNKVTFYGTTKINREYKVVEEKYPLKVEKNYDLVFPGIGFLNIKETAQILSNKENLEIRLDISEVEYE